MLRFFRSIAIGIGIALATPLLAGHASTLKPYNLSSHPPEFFRDLLAGRVFVYERNGKAAAIHYAADGSTYTCWYSPRRGRFLRAYPGSSWSIGTPNGRSNLEEHWPSPNNPNYRRRRVVIYDPNTGHLHLEAYFKNDNKWRIVRSGWIQAGWPKVLIEECPKLVLPHTLAIDEYQDSADFDHIKANASPVRNHPGAQRQYPGATGLAASDGAPTMTANQVREALYRLHGYISEHARGHRFVLVKRPDHAELWRLGPTHTIIDIGITRLTNNDTVLTTKWENPGYTSERLAGYAIPAIATAEFHPAFKMMKDLAASQAPISISSNTGTPTPHTFKPDGTLHAGNHEGTWAISRGEIRLTANGQTRSYPWEKFAEMVSWTP